MKSFLLVTLLFLQNGQKNHLIDWNAERKLSWNDFQGTAVTNSDNAALTSSNINFKFGYGSSGFTYSITCQFDKSRSWVRIKNDFILAHEQGHFDIAEIHARLLKKVLSNYVYQEATASADINKFYADIMKQHHEMQEQYDQQTDHSRKTEQQVAWLKKIEKRLQEMSAFKDYR